LESVGEPGYGIWFWAAESSKKKESFLTGLRLRELVQKNFPPGVILRIRGEGLDADGRDDNATVSRERCGGESAWEKRAPDAAR
jgi:hypothetical protein